MADDPLRHRLTRLPPERLADELIDLGNRDGEVRERLGMLAAESDPEALAEVLRRRIDNLGQTQDYISYGRSFAFAQDLRHIVSAIRNRLLPRDPDLVFELADLFLQSDVRVFECVDDSAGAVGDVFRDACKLWLEAAAKSIVKRDWVALFKERIGKDDYGSRDELLPNAAILFSEAELRTLAAQSLDEARKARPEVNGRDWQALSGATTASQLAIALKDPGLYEEAITAVGGSLNDIQRIDVAKRYLEFGDAETALARLSELADGGSTERLDLFAECYGRLGRVREQIAILEKQFERTLSKRQYDEILRLRPETEQEVARQWARTLALSFDTLYTAAIFLFEAGWPDDAERIVLDRSGDLATRYYPGLQDLAALADASGCRLVEVVCYRHLIRDILNDARSKAYGHAVKYYRSLEALDPLITDYGSLGDHASFVAELRKKHGRKSAFWGRLDEKKR